jgi:hypothetical protein
LQNFPRSQHLGKTFTQRLKRLLLESYICPQHSWKGSSEILPELNLILKEKEKKQSVICAASPIIFFLVLGIGLAINLHWYIPVCINIYVYLLALKVLYTSPHPEIHPSIQSHPIPLIAPRCNIHLRWRFFVLVKKETIQNIDF